MRMVYFRRDCQIIDTWDVMGMRGTGSNDISVTDAHAPGVQDLPRWCRTSSPDRTIGARYRLPVVGAAAGGIPTPMLGVARRALDDGDRPPPTKTPWPRACC